MRSTAPKRLTIKTFAHEYFTRVSFVDIYGRNIGYDYDFILHEIKRNFPGAKTSRRWLQNMAYVLNRSEKLPARRRSRRSLAEDFAMSLLIKPSRTSINGIRVDVRQKFSDQTVTISMLRSLEVRLRNRGFEIPLRS